MKLKIICIIAVSFCFHSCSKYETTPIDFDKDTDQVNEVFLVSTATHSAQEAQLFDIINQHRLANDLSELSFEGASYYFAGKHSKYMMAQGVTSHDNFTKRAQQVAISTGASNVAENVAKDYDTIEEVFKAWMDSDEHKAIIEGDYTNSAISIKKNEEGDLYFTQMFSK